MRKRIVAPRVFSTTEVISRVYETTEAQKLIARLRSLPLTELEEMRCDLGNRVNFTLEKLIRAKRYQNLREKMIFD